MPHSMDITQPASGHTWPQPRSLLAPLGAGRLLGGEGTHWRGSSTESLSHVIPSAVTALRPLGAAATGTGQAPVPQRPAAPEAGLWSSAGSGPAHQSPSLGPGVPGAWSSVLGSQVALLVCTRVCGKEEPYVTNYRGKNTLELAAV